MSVILLILKIIGILFLVLLGIFLFLLLAVLFYPAGYRITGRIEEDVWLQVKFHWLLHLLYFRFQMVQGEQKAVLYICGIPVWRYPERMPKQRRSRKKRSREERDFGKEDVIVSMELSGNTPEYTDLHETIPEDTEDREKNTAEDTFISSEKMPETEAETEDDRHYKPDISYRLELLKKKITRFFRRIQQFFALLPKKIKGMYQHVADWKSILTDEENKASLSLIWREIKYLLFHYKPRSLKADLCYGLGDPALTGKSLAVLSMIPFLYQKQVQIVPDFETERIFVKGNLDAKGRIRVFHLIRSGLHIWKDKNSRKFIGKLRK